MFRLKHLRVLNADPLLQEIVLSVATEFDMWTITSGYRPHSEGSVHSTQPLRGLDLRCRNAALGKLVKQWVNKRWAYDPERPWKKCARFHDAGSGWHLHFQVHPNTLRRDR